MPRPPLLRLLATASAASAVALATSAAFAQAPPLDDSFVLGGWTFRPSLEVRLRGEYRRHPVDTGGADYASTAVLAESYGSTLLPVATTVPAIDDQYFVAERSRLGLAVDRGPVSAVLTLQDARALGTIGAGSLGISEPVVGPGEPFLSSFAPLDAYVDVHARSGRRMFLRLGRQRVTWGDGRLLSADEWSPTARALDAARFGVQVGDVDLEGLGALLAAPGVPSGVAPAGTGTSQPAATEGTGAQLYGLDAVWHLWPLLNVEATGLARFVRDPVPLWLTPGDTYVGDGRLFGDHRGFHYSIEGAYEGGRVASYGTNRSLSAYAVAARASLETALPWHLTFGARGASASGDNGSPTGTEKRFDPILPDEHENTGPMGLYAWSNDIEIGGHLSVRPAEELELIVGYRNLHLAEANGRWTTAALAPVGASLGNTSTSLGNELDVTVKLSPWKPIGFEAGYGLFAFGDGAKAILEEAGRPATLQHWVYLQTIVRAPY
jgi:hypothetical protein